MADLFRYPPVMENAGLPPVIRFGACEVDSRAGELRKNGIKIRIQQQPFQVLMALLERPGGVVSREELRSRLWPNDTFVDFEHGLNAAVKRLRDALGESAENPVFIETLAKRGYRFVGSVSGNHASHPAMHPPTSPTPTLPRQHFPTVVIGVAAGILISLSVAILWRKPAPDGSKPPFDGLEFRLTANSPENPVTAAALSPDGKYLAYSDSTGLYLKLVSTGETHAIGLPKDFRGMPVNWFPDSAHLLLVGDQVGDRGLWSISLSGAGLSKLAESGLSGSVSPDGSQIAFIRGFPKWGDYGSELWTVDADGTNQRRVVSVVNGVIGAVSWSPDSRHLALSRSLWDTHLQSTAFLEVISSDGSERKSLLSSPVLGPVVAWLPGNRLVYTLQEPDPNRGDNNAWLLQMDASLNTSGNPLRLTRGHGWISGMTATSDGKRLSLLRSTWSGHVFLARLSSDQNRILGLRRLTLEESQDLPTAWTPDSKAVLFNSDRNGHSEIFKQAVNETQPQLLVSSANNSILPRLTPLGNEVIYQSVVRDAPPNTEVSVMAVPLRGGVPHKIVSMPGIGNVECARHPADVCVLHAGTGNRRTFFRLNLKSGETSELMHVDGEATVNWGLSPDGSRLVVAPYSPDNNILDLYSMASGQSARIAIKGGNGIATVDWASDSKSLFVGTMDRTGHIALLHVTLDGTAHTLREGVSPALCGCPYWAIQSPDGKWAAIKQPDGSSNVWTLQDFY